MWGKIAGGIHRMQRRFGNTLNKKTSKFTRRGKIVLLVLICLFFGGGSLYVLVDGLSDRSAVQNSKPNAIQAPAHIDKTGDARGEESIVTEREIKRIKSIRNYLDSLQTSVEGKKIMDSIVRVRPGFLDSLREVEYLYGIDTTTKVD
jgi:hypothetical protein